LRRFKGDDIRAGNFFRDTALFLEHYEVIEESLFFMSKAKMYSPSLKPIDDKLEKYKAILENTKEDSGQKKTNTKKRKKVPKLISMSSKALNKLLKWVASDK
jgi:hypothetical protein